GSPSLKTTALMPPPPLTVTVEAIWGGRGGRLPRLTVSSPSPMYSATSTFTAVLLTATVSLPVPAKSVTPVSKLQDERGAPRLKKFGAARGRATLPDVMV